MEPPLRKEPSFGTFSGVAPDDEDLEQSKLEAAAEIVESIRRIERLNRTSARHQGASRIDVVAVNAALVIAIVVVCAISLITSLVG